ncbi:MAG: outer membrane protein assembly factor BamC [Motiliproteus sp.]|jgi:outer membrane protein assembly factor BamC
MKALKLQNWCNVLMLSSRPLVAGLLVLISGCSVISDNDLIGGNDAVIRDRAQDYEASQVSTALVVPANLDSEKIKPLLVIPDIGTAATVSEQAFEIPRPDFFIAEAGNEKVSLARDGQERMIIVNEPLTDVWNQLLTFWRSNSQQLVLTDPQRGLMETAWEDSGEEEPGFVSRLVTRLTTSEPQGSAHDKLRLYLKAVDNDKTSISLRHLRASVTDISQAADWSGNTGDAEYRSQMLYEILHYLSLSAEPSTASAVRERQNQQGRVYFGRGSQGEPVLKLTSSVDEAWQRVQQALVQAEVDVGSADKGLGKYYITHTSTIPVESEKSVGFFDWLHGERDAITFDMASIGSALSVNADKQGPRYSTGTVAEVPLNEEEKATEKQQQLEASEGYKIRIGDKVIYSFGGVKDKRLNVDKKSGAVTFTGRYQIQLKRRSSGVYISVLTPVGEPAVTLIAEDVLWILKENMPEV